MLTMTPMGTTPMTDNDNNDSDGKDRGDSNGDD
jgi:hypothetical protein